MIANTYVVKPFGISEVKVIALKGDPGSPTQEQVNNAVDEYMTEHPEAQIPDGAVSTAKLADGAVTTPKLADGSVTEPKIADEAITTEKMASNTVAPYADNLVSSSYVSDSEPYLFRKTFAGVREDTEIVGGNVVWNQLIDVTTKETKTSQGITYTNNGDGSFTLTGTPTSNNCFENINYSAGVNPYILDHVYMMASGYNGTEKIGIRIYGMTSVSIDARDVPIIRKADQIATNGYVCFQVGDLQNTDIGTVKLTPQMHDLTLLFGPTIADYIYSLEQATAGAGVAFFRSLFSKPYYAYNAGTLMSVNTSAHKMVGFNQWDEEWELGGLNSNTGDNTVTTNYIRSKNYISVLPQTAYYFKTPFSIPSSSIYVFYYDANKSFLEGGRKWSATQTTPQSARYMRFFFAVSAYGSSTYNNDICINLSNPSKNGTYEPYTAHEYPLDSLTLRGIPTIVDGKLKYDGDVRYADKAGTITVGKTDMGSLNWVKDGQIFYATVADKLNNAVNFIEIDSRYTCLVSNATNITQARSALTSDKYAMASNGSSRPYVYVRDDSCADVEALKSVVSGIMLHYALATPVTQTSGGMLERRYRIDDLGTLNWSAGTDNVFYSTGLSTKKAGNWNILCSAYSVTTATTTSGMQDKECKGHATNKYIYIRDTAYSSASDFKMAMSGVMLLYEVETPTTETTEPFTNPQVCYPDGTEEYIDTRDVPIPVGHNTKYMRDLKKILEGIPDAPTTNGTYVLKATVSSSGVTYAWIAG